MAVASAPHIFRKTLARPPPPPPGVFLGSRFVQLNPDGRDDQGRTGAELQALFGGDERERQTLDVSQIAELVPPGDHELRPRPLGLIGGPVGPSGAYLYPPPKPPQVIPPHAIRWGEREADWFQEQISAALGDPNETAEANAMAIAELELANRQRAEDNRQASETAVEELEGRLFAEMERQKQEARRGVATEKSLQTLQSGINELTRNADELEDLKGVVQQQAVLIAQNREQSKSSGILAAGVGAMAGGMFASMQGLDTTSIAAMALGGGVVGWFAGRSFKLT